MCGACSIPFVAHDARFDRLEHAIAGRPGGQAAEASELRRFDGRIGIPSARIRLIQLDHGVGHRLAGAVEDPHAQLQVIAGRIGRRHLAEARVGRQAEMKERANGLR